MNVVQQRDLQIAHLRACSTLQAKALKSLLTDSQNPHAAWGETAQPRHSRRCNQLDNIMQSNAMVDVAAVLRSHAVGLR